MRRRDHTSISISLFAFQDIITSVVGIFILITLLLVLELVRSHASTLSEERAAIAGPDLDERERLEASKERLELSIRDLRSDSASYSKGQISESRKGRLRSQLAAAGADADRLKRTDRAIELEIQALENKIRAAERRFADDPSKTELSGLQDRLLNLQKAVREIRKSAPIVVNRATLTGKDVVVIVISRTKAKATFVSDASMPSEEQVLGRKPADTLAQLCARRAGQSSYPLHVHLLIRPSAATYANEVIAELHNKYAIGFDLISEEQTIRFTR